MSSSPAHRQGLWSATLLALAVLGALVIPAATDASPRPAPAASRPAAGSLGQLSAEHQEWLQVVSYIIEDREREIFENLGTEWQRQQFIAAFWRRRDPLPVTPENEFYIEHMRRWQHANEVIGRDTPTPGWRTDRGRVYIVNGPPFKVYPYPNTQQLWPLEVWEYRDSPREGMPSYYQIIFFKPRVFNEWRLYSPSVDGPEGLVIASPADLDLLDFRQLASRYPIVFEAAERIAPGYTRLDSEVVIARTMAPPTPPRPLVLGPAGEVESSFVTGGSLGLGIEATGFVHPELEGFVDITVEIPTSDATWVQVDDLFVANYEVELEITSDAAGMWREPSGQVIVRIPRGDFESVRNLPIMYRQRLWLLPGDYGVRALLTEVSTRRVGVAETHAEVPPPAALQVGQPTLFYVTEDGGTGWDRHIPWIDPRLRRGLPVVCAVRVSGDAVAPVGPGSLPTVELTYQVRQGGESVWSETWSGRAEPGKTGDEWGLVHTLDLAALPVGSYELQVSARALADDGTALADLGVVGRRPVELVDEFLPFARILPVRTGEADLAASHHLIGQQLLRRNEFERARVHFEQAVRLDAQSSRYQIDAAKTYVHAGQLNIAAFFLESAIRREPRSAEAWGTYGLLYVQQGEFAKAIDAYERSLDFAPGTPSIYNGLAEALLSSGDMSRGLEMLELSLEINPEQEQVRQLRDRLKGQSD